MPSLIVLAAVFVGHALYAQEANLFLAGNTLRLGMPKTSVLKLFEGNHKLDQIDEKSWLIFERTAPPYRIVGSLVFEDGKLSGASKYWGSFDERGALDFSNDLFSLLSNLGQEGEALAVIKTSAPLRQPGSTTKKVQFTFPHKKIILLIAEDREKGSSVSMQEILEE